MKAAEKDEPIKGEQSVKELIGQGQGVSSMPIDDDGIKDFKKICNKYGCNYGDLISFEKNSKTNTEG